MMTLPLLSPETLQKQFTERYGGSPHDVRIFAAPARINIIGEHIDYNGGHVLPMAIDRFLYCAIRKRTDKTVTYQDVRFSGIFSFLLDDKFVYKKENDYANYLNGILSVIQKRGYAFPCGFDALIASTIPPAGGISSSSALECGFAYAVSELYGFGISRKDIALIGQQSEHEFMHVNCGIMDQYIIATAHKQTAELIDCAAVTASYIPLVLTDCQFIVMNTNKKRQLADSKYNERRRECEAGLTMLRNAACPLPPGGEATNTSALPHLCALTPEQFATCEYVLEDAVIKRRVRHCVTEMQRVHEAAAAIRANDIPLLGSLLSQSHESLRTDYEVTGIELDTLVAAAQKAPGCFGARMTGAGFGGCAIALVKKNARAAFIDIVQNTYEQTIGHSADFFVGAASDGVHEINLHTM
ncbi:MAG: galactokinase [Treponema sp.]|nr:galactokinase [Treponema sp.]